MAFEFVVGPQRTSLSLEQIGHLIKSTGNERKFMGLARKLGTGSLGAGTYGPFVPRPDDDPFATTRQQPDARIGWRWGNEVSNSMGMTLSQGWQVIFEMSAEGSSRTVTAQVSGQSQRSEVQKFVRSVFDQL